MMHPFKPWVAGLLLALGTGTWVATSYYRQQNRLYVQLEQLKEVLATENEAVARQVSYTFQEMQAAVAKNHNLPADVAVLRRAEALQNAVRNLRAMLSACANDLHQAVGTPVASSRLLYPAAPANPLLSESHQKALAQQVVAVADTLRRLGPAGSAPLVAPVFGSDIRVAEALAALTQFDSEVLTRQAQALLHLKKFVGTPVLLANRLQAVASAEANVVAPGDTYRAELFLAAHFGPELHMQMACNGRPVAVGPDGVGLVRFRAPLKPGPATWTGTVRINQNGRDTTFVVRVPYRVVRR